MGQTIIKKIRKLNFLIWMYVDSNYYVQNDTLSRFLATQNATGLSLYNLQTLSIKLY